MNLRTVASAVLALCAVCVAGCKDVGSDRPAPQPEATEPTAPSPDAVELGADPDPELDTDADEVPDGPPPDTPETPTDEQTDSPEDVVEDLDHVLEEIAALEKDAQFFAAFKRARDLSTTYRDRPEVAELIALQQRLYKYHRRSSGLDFAIRQLGSDSEVAVSVAADKLFAAGEVGLIFLRKAVRQAEPEIAAGAAEILIDQGEPQITRLMVERMEQDPAQPLGDELGKLLRRLDAIESEWIDRLCTLARRGGSSQPGAVGVLIDRLERSIHVQLEVTEPDDGEGEAAEEDKPKQPESAAVEVDPRLVRTLYDVAVTAEGPLPRRAVDALLMLVLEHVNHRDGEAFNQLVGNAQAYGFVGDYVVANLESKQLEDRLWAIPRAAVLRMQASGFWASVRSDDGSTVVYERLDPVLSFGNLDALRATGPVEQGQTVRWTGFVNVPADGDYTFSVDCAEASPTTLFVGSEQTAANKAVELSAGWHEMRAEMSLSGDQARIQVAWEGPDLDEQDIPVVRVVCADRTRMLIWQLGRKCDLGKARSLAEQLVRSLGRVDKELAEKLMALARVDNPARPAIAAALGALLDYSIAHESEPPEWETEALPLLLSASDQISGPEQQRVVASLVNHFVRRTDGKIEEFNNQADSPEAYGDVRAFIAERLDANERSDRLWAAEHAEPFTLLGSGLEGSYFGADFKTRLFDRVHTKMQFEPGQFGYPDKRNDNMGIRWSGLIGIPADGKYIFSCAADDTCRLRLDGQPVIEDAKRPATANLTAGLHEIHIEFVETTGPERLVVYWQPPGQSEPRVLQRELRHVDLVQLLVYKLTDRPDDPQATTWLEELSYKADRLNAETIENLNELASERASWQVPLARVAAAAVFRDPGKAPTSAAPLLAESAPGLNDDVRRQAVEALVAYFSAACGSDRQKFGKAVASDKTYDFLCGEVQSIADSAKATDTDWAQEQAKLLGLKISSTVHQEPDGRVVLEARLAALHGNTIKYESGDGKDNLGFWTNAEDFASWRLAVAKGGTFAVSLTWACEDGYEGSEFVVAAADQQLTGKVAATGDWADFQTMDLGTIKLDAGTHQLTVKPKAIPTKALMNLKSIALDFRE